VFDDLDKAFKNPEKELFNGSRVIAGSLKNEAAELVISNMYASKFNTKGTALAEIIDKGSDFFRVRRIKAIQSKHYEMAFTANNGKHTYISFKTPRVDSENAFKPKNIGWKYTKTVKDDVYCTTRDGQVLFKVGHNILRTGIDYING
jgi:hypothetical protein